LFQGSAVFLREGMSSIGNQGCAPNRQTNEDEIPENSVLSHSRPFLFST